VVAVEVVEMVEEVIANFVTFLLNLELAAKEAFVVFFALEKLEKLLPKAKLD
jgi:hypothetical protein